MNKYIVIITNYEGETCTYLDISEVEIINGHITLTSISGYKEYFDMLEINKMKIELVF